MDRDNPRAGYLVVPGPTQGLTGVQLRHAGNGTARRARMCSLCTTTHGGQGVTLMVAPRAGRPGRDGNTVGLEMCTTLACADYARGALTPPGVSSAHETLTVEDRRARLRRNALAFVGRVMAT